MNNEASSVPMEPATAAPVRKRGTQLIAVGGGKGGIGKSLVSANLAMALARRGARVVVVDVDLGGANLHTCLGLGAPKRTLSDFIEHRVSSLQEVLVPTQQERLWLISGAGDGLDAANPRHSQKSKLFRHLRTLEVDYVLLDLGAGTSFNVIDFFVVADKGIVVILPEPTSIENAYRFLKASFVRRIQAVAPDQSFSTLLATTFSKRDASGRSSPMEVVEQLKRARPADAHRIDVAMRQFRPWIVVNQARTRQDFDIGPSVASAWLKFFGLELGFLGAVSHDESVLQAVRNRSSLLGTYPESAAARGILRMADILYTLER